MDTTDDSLCFKGLIGNSTQPQRMLARDINDHIHLTFPHNIFPKVNSNPTNHRQGAGVVGFCAAAMIVFNRMHETPKGRGGPALFVWDIASNTNRSDVTPQR